MLKLSPGGRPSPAQPGLRAQETEWNGHAGVPAILGMMPHGIGFGFLGDFRDAARDLRLAVRKIETVGAGR